MSTITALEDLEAIYGHPGETSLVKVADRITDAFRRIIEASPLAVLATAGPEGLDCSPRGDRPGFVRIADARTLLLPDRRGNNRIDSLRNIVRDPRVALLFLVPGYGNTLRLNGRAAISAEPALLESFSVDGKTPRTVLVITVEAIYFQCARAVVRSGLWTDAARVDPKTLPTPGAILEDLSTGRIDGAAYDADWPGRAAKTMW